MSMPKSTWIILALTVSCGTSAALGQGPAVTDTTTLDGIFLHAHCRDAARRAAGLPGPTANDVAARLGVSTPAIAVLDSVCASLAADEASLRDEALRAHEASQKTGKPLDISVVRQFTARRVGLTASAMTRLQSGMTPAGYAALSKYISGTFARSLRAATVAR
jgi:hypothetical protein